MNYLIVGGTAFLLGGGVMLGLSLWHQRRLQRAVAAERRAGRQERDRLQGLADRLAEDVRFNQEKAASLQAGQALAAEYDRGYLAGMHHGAELNDVDRMAYSLDQKKPERLLRMDRNQRRNGA